MNSIQFNSSGIPYNSQSSKSSESRESINLLLYYIAFSNTLHMGILHSPPSCQCPPRKTYLSRSPLGPTHPFSQPMKPSPKLFNMCPTLGSTAGSLVEAMTARCLPDPLGSFLVADKTLEHRLHFPHILFIQTHKIRASHMPGIPWLQSYHTARPQVQQFTRQCLIQP